MVRATIQVISRTKKMLSPFRRLRYTNGFRNELS